jgi:hypothetical protein
LLSLGLLLFEETARKRPAAANFRDNLPLRVKSTGLAFLAETTVPKITVLPILTTTDPSACLQTTCLDCDVLPSPKSILSTNNVES